MRLCKVGESLSEQIKEEINRLNENEETNGDE